MVYNIKKRSLKPNRTDTNFELDLLFNKLTKPRVSDGPITNIDDTHINKIISNLNSKNINGHDLVNHPEEYEFFLNLIANSKSLDKSEKNTWLALLPLMNNIQIIRLCEILVKEVTKINEIKKKYEAKNIEIKKNIYINGKMLNNKKTFYLIEKRQPPTLYL